MDFLVAITLSTFYLTVLGIIIPSLNRKENFNIPKFNKKAEQNYAENGQTDFW